MCCCMLDRLAVGRKLNARHGGDVALLNADDGLKRARKGQFSRVDLLLDEGGDAIFAEHKAASFSRPDYTAHAHGYAVARFIGKRW